MESITDIILGHSLISIHQRMAQLPCCACHENTARLIAMVPSQPMVDVDFWGKWGSYAWVLFWYCERCQAILTYSETD